MKDVELVLFRGFGSGDKVCVAGRVIRPTQWVSVEADSRLRKRLRDAWKLLISRRIPRAEIDLRCAGSQWRICTDEHGYFFDCHHLGSPLDNSAQILWQPYSGRIRAPSAGNDCVASSTILQAPPEADQLIISDIDDTVVHTGVANKLRMLWELYATSGTQRSPFPGMSAFLQALHRGSSGTTANPMLYVSRSPWSIYPMLDVFFNTHSIPIGPVLLLRDWGITLRHPFPRKAEDHKAVMIEHAMSAYPHLPTILIGDSGQRDAEVYAQITERFPGRVKAIYIRDLGLRRNRSALLHAMQERLRQQHVHFLAAPDTETMVRDARQHRLIADDATCGENGGTQDLAS